MVAVACVSVLIVIFVLVIAGSLADHTSDTNEPSSHRFTLSIGDVGTIDSPSMLADTVEDWGIGIKAKAAHDDTGVVELLMQGRAFPVESGTSVRVIDLGHFEGFALYRLRVLEGEKSGSAGWVGTRAVTRPNVK